MAADAHSRLKRWLHSIANLRLTAFAAPVCSARLERAVGVQAHEYRGKRCGVLSSCKADAAVAQQANQTAGEDSPHAILKMQASVALLQQALSLAGSHVEGAADALWAEGLEVEALALSLAVAAVGQAHSRWVGVKARHTAQVEVEQHALEGLAAAAESRRDLLVHLRVGGQRSPDCAGKQKGAGEARARVRWGGGSTCSWAYE